MKDLLCKCFIIICLIEKIFNFLTIYFQFTQEIIGECRVPSRIGWMSPVVVVDDVSSMVGTLYGDRIRYCGSGVLGVPKT